MEIGNTKVLMDRVDETVFTPKAKPLLESLRQRHAQSFEKLIDPVTFEMCMWIWPRDCGPNTPGLDSLGRHRKHRNEKDHSCYSESSGRSGTI